MTTSIPTDSLEVKQIKKGVESRFGLIPSSPADFAELSLHIKLAIGKDISADTLSRIWGYKKGYLLVRHSTLQILETYSHVGTDSDFIYNIAIKADEMPIGGKVRIAWLPDRMALLEYKGNYRWDIKEITNSKLHVGDSFFCRVIAQGQPLIVDNLSSGQQSLAGYTIGGRNGLTIVQKETVYHKEKL